MCAVYEICEVCNVDHWYDDTVCRWPITAMSLFWLELHPKHPHVEDGLEQIEWKIRSIIDNPSFKPGRDTLVHINPS